jgi:hypothetical protein
MNDPNQYPEGWDRDRVQRVIDHYDNQTEEEEYEEIEAALSEDNVTLFAVPNELADEVRALLARKRVA